MLELPWLYVWAAVLVPLWVLLLVLVVRQARQKRAAEAARRAPGDPALVNGLAQTAAITSFFILGAPLVLAVIALVQIHRHGDRGRGLAIRAIVVQILALAAVLLYAVLSNEPPSQ